MWDFIQNHKKLIQILLGIMFLPFAFFGIDHYFRSSDRAGHVATVGGQPISQSDFSQALRDRQETVQRMTGGRIDAAALDSPELRFGVLDGLIRQRVMINRAVRSGIVISDQQLHELIREQPIFHDNGKFSNARYEELLRRQSMSPLAFEAGLRRDLILERLADAYRSTAIVPNALAERVLRINGQQREVAQATIEPAKFSSEVKLDPGAPTQYYESHQNEFQIPERARVDYVVLSLDGIAAEQQVSAEEVRQAYEQNLAQYAKGEERQASHILITADAQANAETKQAARTKAEQLAKQVKQNPSAFADLAKKHSQDPGSAERGGDLGFFARGTMVKPFDEAVFQMKQGEIAGPVESPFGYHIIRLTAVKGRGFEDVKKQIELDIKRQRAGKRFSELAEQLNNLVFEQGDSLKPAADALKLPIQHGAWVSRGRAEVKQLNHPKFLQSVFSEDVVKNKRNTEVVDVGNNTLVAARIVEYQAAAVRPFAEVSAEITKKLTQQQEAQIAAKRGRELLDKLKQGESAAVNWSAPKLVSRENPQDFGGAALTQAFRVDSSKLPAYVGVESSEGGFVLLKVTRIVEADKIDGEKRKAARDQLRQLVAQEELSAYVESLKRKSDVKIQQDQLGKKQE